MRCCLVFLLLLQCLANGQTSKTQKKTKAVQADTAAVAVVPADTLDPQDKRIKASGKFAMYSKRESGVDKRMKFCFQLTGEKILNYCYVDSICRDPEVYRELFRKKDGDTTYLLLYADAFTKGSEKPCDGGHETRLLFIRWNTVINKPVIRQRTISSCIRGITNMTGHDIAKWDGSGPLLFSYHKGGTRFYDAKFDPAAFKEGMQTIKKNAEKEEED